MTANLFLTQCVHPVRDGHIPSQSRKDSEYQNFSGLASEHISDQESVADIHRTGAKQM